MSEKKEIESVIKSIRSGLKKYSKEFEEAAERFLTKEEKMNEPEIDCVIQSVCSEYGITKRVLIYSDARGSVQDAKRMSYCLLHFNLGLTVRYIAQRIFFNSHGVVFQGIKSFRLLNDKVKTDREFKEKYEKLQRQLQKNTE